eukprot:568479_1
MWVILLYIIHFISITTCDTEENTIAVPHLDSLGALYWWKLHHFTQNNVTQKKTQIIDAFNAFIPYLQNPQQRHKIPQLRHFQNVVNDCHSSHKVYDFLTRDNQCMLSQPINDYVFGSIEIATSLNLAPQALAIGTYTGMQLLFHLNFRLNDLNQLMNQWIPFIGVLSQHNETILHIAARNVDTDINRNTLKQWLTVLPYPTFEHLWLTNDTYGVSVWALIHHFSRTDMIQTIDEVYGTRIEPSTSNNLMNNNRYSYKQFIIVSSAVLTSLFFTIAVVAFQWFYILSLLKLKLIVPISNVLLWSTLLNHYLEYFDMYPHNDSIHFKIHHVVQSLSYGYGAAVMVLVFNHLWKIVGFREKVYGDHISTINHYLQWNYKVIVISIALVSMICSIVPVVYEDNHCITSTELISEWMILVLFVIHTTSCLMIHVWNRGYVKSKMWENILEKELGKYHFEWRTTYYRLWLALATHMISNHHWCDMSLLYKVYITCACSMIDMAVVLAIVSQKRSRQSVSKKGDNSDSISNTFPVHSTTLHTISIPLETPGAVETEGTSSKIKDICLHHLNENGAISSNTLDRLVNTLFADKVDTETKSEFLSIVRGWNMNKIIHLVKQLEEDDDTQAFEPVQESSSSKKHDLPMLSSVPSNKTAEITRNNHWKPRSKSANLTQFVSQRKAARWENARGSKYRPNIAATAEESWQYNFFSDCSTVDIVGDSTMSISAGVESAHDSMYMFL